METEKGKREGRKKQGKKLGEREREKRERERQRIGQIQKIKFKRLIKIRKEYQRKAQAS